MYKKFFFILIQILFISLYAQDVQIGQFKEYLSYRRFHSVAQDAENIYAATDKSIMVVDKRDGSKAKWSKLNGLSEIGVQSLHSDQNGSLIVVYRNSNIDIIKNYKVHNIRDILNKQITGSKTINNICTFGELAYFSCDFGVVILNLKTLLVKDSWFTIRNDETYRAFSVSIHHERYYLATNKGVFSLPVSASNPADFSTWIPESELPNATYRLLCSYQSKLFAVREEGNIHSLFVYEDSHWKYDESMEMDNYRNFEVKEDKMLVCDWNHVKIFTGDTYVRYFWEATPPNRWANGQKATFDAQTNIWVADLSSGLVHINTETRKNDNITAEGPAISGAYGLFFADGALAVVPGERAVGFYPDFTSPAISVMKEDHWWVHSDFSRIKKAAAFNSVVINPLNSNEIYMASWVGGLYKINKATLEINHYNRDNSILQVPGWRLAEMDSSLFVSGLTVDKQNYLWMAHTESPEALKVIDLNNTDKEWYAINIGNFGNQTMVEHVLIDSRNYKWVTLPRENRLIVVRGSPDKIERSKYNVDLVSQANIAASRTTCIAEDREGRIWIGTNQGVKVIYDASAAFDRTIYAKNILIEQTIGDTSYVQNLLEFEYITCIAVDAADRKWIGTEGAGVFLISPSGTQQLFHFSTENSPLFSNRIHDIKINPENGEVFIATADGLISYKGTATIAKDNYKEVLVFPNPVREDYFGPIAVRGLMEDSFCKITDGTGKLVWQGYAYGGQLIWNGKDFYGKRPATGVYFVMASSKSGKEKKVAKFLFIQ